MPQCCAAEYDEEGEETDDEEEEEEISHAIVLCRMGKFSRK